MIDEQFIQRVYKSSIGWSLLILSYLLMARLVPAAAGFAVGVGLALAGLHSFDAFVKTTFVPGAKGAQAKVKMGVIGFVKYILFALIIALVVRSGWMSLPAFAAGVGVPSAVIFLKALGHYFHEIEFHPFWGQDNHLDPQRVRSRVREGR